jgi:outer membrane receptor protein involved in Fe transport
VSAPDPLLLPAFTRVDAAVSYRLNEHWDWALNVENLLDKKIFVNASVGSAIEIAAPRTATLRVGYRF